MARKTLPHIPFIHLLVLLLCSAASPSLQTHRQESNSLVSGSIVQETEVAEQQKDVTTPLTTVPLKNSPSFNPTDSNQDSPTITTPSTTSAGSSSGSWCVASRSATPAALQAALDYACSHGGADCSPIQPGGGCFAPVTLRHHASYALNSYYQRNPTPTSCNFAGSAVTTSTDPSYGTCQYPSISTTSSVLNTTNSIGSRVFGPGKVPPSPTAAAVTNSISCFRHILQFLALLVYFSQFRPSIE